MTYSSLANDEIPLLNASLIKYLVLQQYCCSLLIPYLKKIPQTKNKVQAYMWLSLVVSPTSV